MATDHGLHVLRGKLGNQVFTIRNGKRIVRSAPTQPTAQTEATRKSARDFGTANSAAALIRTGFKPLIQTYADGQFDDRLKSRVIQIVQTGPQALKGHRRFADGNMALLKGLELNQYTAVGNLLRCVPAVSVVPGGDITITLPRQKLAEMLAPPPKAAAAVIQFRCCLLYFEEKKGLYVTPDDLVLPVEKTVFPGGSFSLPLEGADNCVIIPAWGVYFTAKDGGHMIQNRKYYAGNLLEVVHLEDGAVKVFTPEAPVAAEVPAGNTTPRVQWKMEEE